jgi:uncharacterized RDD family membrane protein YckC
MSGLGGGRPITGKFNRDRLRLQKRRFYNNSFAPFFYGEVRPTDAGSELVGEFKLHPFVRVFMGIWFTGAMLGATAITMTVLVRGHAAHAGPALAIPFALPLAGFGILRFGRWLARNEPPFIVQFLERCAASDSSESVAVETESLAASSSTVPEWLNVNARRLAAICWDSFWAALPGFAWMFAHGLPQPPVVHGATVRPPPVPGAWLLIVWVAYDATFLAWRGQTLGKSWAGLRVEGENGAPSVRQALERTAVKFMFFGPLVWSSSHALLPLGILAVLIDAAPLVASERRLALHDWIAGTRVVLARVGTSRPR